jgi:hypothetical protein
VQASGRAHTSVKAKNAAAEHRRAWTSVKANNYFHGGRKNLNPCLHSHKFVDTSSQIGLQEIKSLYVQVIETKLNMGDEFCRQT